jgi:hypothetical protein
MRNRKWVFNTINHCQIVDALECTANHNGVKIDRERGMRNDQAASVLENQLKGHRVLNDIFNMQ